MSQEYINEEQINEIMNNSRGEAEKLLNNKDELERTLERIERKLEKIPFAGESLAMVPVFISLVKNNIWGEYKDIPYGTIIAVVGVLLYLLSPVDVIPDILPGVGLLDDAAVLTACYNLFKDDIDEYKEWKRANNK